MAVLESPEEPVGRNGPRRRARRDRRLQSTSGDRRRSRTDAQHRASTPTTRARGAQRHAAVDRGGRTSLPMHTCRRAGRALRSDRRALTWWPSPAEVIGGMAAGAGPSSSATTITLRAERSSDAAEHFGDGHDVRQVDAGHVGPAARRRWRPRRRRPGQPARRWWWLPGRAQRYAGRRPGDGPARRSSRGKGGCAGRAAIASTPPRCGLRYHGFDVVAALGAQRGPAGAGGATDDEERRARLAAGGRRSSGSASWPERRLTPQPKRAPRRARGGGTH